MMNNYALLTGLLLISFGWLSTASAADGLNLTQPSVTLVDYRATSAPTLWAAGPQRASRPATSRRRSPRSQPRNDLHIGAGLSPGLFWTPSIQPTLREAIATWVSLGVHRGHLGVDLELAWAGADQIWSTENLAPHEELSILSGTVLGKFFPIAQAQSYDPYIFAGGGYAQSSTGAPSSYRLAGPIGRVGGGLYYRRGTHSHHSLTWIDFRLHYALFPAIGGPPQNIDTAVGQALFLEVGFSLNLWSRNFRII